MEHGRGSPKMKVCCVGNMQKPKMKRFAVVFDVFQNVEVKWVLWGKGQT